MRRDSRGLAESMRSARWIHPSSERGGGHGAEPGMPARAERNPAGGTREARPEAGEAGHHPGSADVGDGVAAAVGCDSRNVPGSGRGKQSGARAGGVVALVGGTEVWRIGWVLRDIGEPDDWVLVRHGGGTGRARNSVGISGALRSGAGTGKPVRVERSSGDVPALDAGL